MPDLEIKYSEGIDAYERTVSTGNKDLRKMGLQQSPRPMANDKYDERPSLPRRLSALSMEQLQDLLGVFTEWFTYANDQIPMLKANRDAVEGAKAFSWASIRRNTQGTVSDRDNATTVDARYVDIATKLEVADYKYRAVSTIANGLKRELDTISRMITALEQRSYVSDRSSAVDAKRKRPRNQFSPTTNDALRQFRK